MPTYVYQVIEADGSDGEVFEVFQKMSEPPLTHHPGTGRPVRRLIQAPRIAGQRSTKRMLSDRNLDRLGFTKYEKTGDGTYEKRAGPGPDMMPGASGA